MPVLFYVHVPVESYRYEKYEPTFYTGMMNYLFLVVGVDYKRRRYDAVEGPFDCFQAKVQ